MEIWFHWSSFTRADRRVGDLLFSDQRAREGPRAGLRLAPLAVPRPLSARATFDLIGGILCEKGAPTQQWQGHLTLRSTNEAPFRWHRSPLRRTARRAACTTWWCVRNEVHEIDD